MRARWREDPVLLWNYIIGRCEVDAGGCWVWGGATNTYRRKSNGNRQCKMCSHLRYLERRLQCV